MNTPFEYLIIASIVIALVSGWMGEYVSSSKNHLSSFWLIYSAVLSALAGGYVVMRFGISPISLLGVPLAHLMGSLVSTKFYENIIQIKQEQRRIKTESRTRQSGDSSLNASEGKIDTEEPTLLLNSLHDKWKMSMVGLFQIPFGLFALFFLLGFSTLNSGISPEPFAQSPTTPQTHPSPADEREM